MVKITLQVGLAFFVIFSVIGALSAQTDLDLFRKRCKKPKGLLVGVFCQYFVLPLLGYLTAIVFGFDDVLAASLCIVCTCPGGTLSNVFTFLFGADLALSLAMTTTTSILSFAFILWNGWLYVDIALDPKESDSDDDSSDDSEKDTRVRLDYAGMALSVTVLILALIFGLGVSYKKWMIVQRILKFCGVISILLMIVVAFMDNFSADENIGDLGWRYWIGVIVLNICAWFSGIVIALMAGLSKPSALAMAIEISNQNTSLSAVLIYLSFPDKDDANKGVGIPLMYTFCCWMVVLVLGPIFQFLLDGWTIQEEDTPEGTEKLGFGARFRAAVAKASAKVTDDSKGHDASKKDSNDDRNKVSTNSEIAREGHGHITVGGKVSVQDDGEEEDPVHAAVSQGNSNGHGSNAQLLKKEERPSWNVTNDEDSSSSSSEIDID